MRSHGDNREPRRIGASVMRKLNAALLLDLIRKTGPVSRAELSRASGLTKPTVSSQVADLVRRGLVVEDGEGEPDAHGGKPPKLLKFHAGWGNLIGAEICASAVRAQLADLNGVVLDRLDAAVSPDGGPSPILDALEGTIEQLLARRPRRERRLLAVGVAAPGRVDSSRGVVLEAGNVFHWRNVAIRDRMERAFRVPVAVENDVNLAVLGEMHHGVARDARNFVLIKLGTGVGAGVVLGRRLYQGSHWAAGEVGHMLLDRTAANCPSIHERGYLESVIASDRLRERAHLTAAPVSLAKALAEAAKHKDQVAAGILADLAAHLSLAVANLAAALDPELIVLDGELFDLVTDRIREVVELAIPWPVRIERSALGNDAVLLGAISMARGIADDVVSGREREGAAAMQVRG